MEEIQWNVASPFGLPLLFGGAAVVLGIAVNVFWMLVGWRAMRAHERIAADLRSFMDGQSERKR